jgi:HEAT repeat protein
LPVNFNFPDNTAGAAALATGAVTLALFAAVLVLRMIHVRQQRRLERLRAAWWPIFAETASSGELATDVPLPKLRRRQKVLLLREWSRFRSLVLGQAALSLNALAARLDLLPLARRRMRRRSIHARLLGLQTVGQMRDGISWSYIDGLLEDPNIAVSVTAATALTEIDADRGIPRIIPLIGRLQRWPRTQVGRILNRAGPGIVSARLCREIADAPADQAILMLQFAESAHSGDINAVAEKLLRTRDEPALLSAALKAVRGRVCPERVIELTRHDVWYVRMQAASLLGRTGNHEDFAALEPLLGDREWWVRYRAAQALVGSPYLGPNALRRIAARQKDRYARDILQQALAEKGLA